MISVGASDPRGTTTVADDGLASFSSSGVPGAEGSKNPDLLAPGRSVASQRLSGRMWSGGSWTGQMWSGDVWSSAGWY